MPSWIRTLAVLAVLAVAAYDADEMMKQYGLACDF